MASLLNRNGTFYAQFYDGDRSPTRKRISLRTKKKSTARALLSKFEKLHRLGEADPWTDDLHEAVQPKRPKAEGTSIGQALRRLLESKRAAGCKENTLRTYRETVGVLADQIGRSRPLSALTASRVRGYVHDEGVAAATRRKRYRQLRAFLRFHDEGDRLSDVEEPRAEKRMPVAIRPDELRSVCEEVVRRYREARSDGRAKPGQIVWRVAVFRFAFLTGLRRSEIAALRWRDVRLGESPAVTLKGQKNRKEQQHPIPPEAARLLRRVRTGSEPRESYVFHGRTEAPTERSERTWGGSLSNAFAKYAGAAGVRDALTFHSLRAGYVTRLAKSGAHPHAVQRLARHGSFRTTQLYLETSGETFRADLDAAFS